MTALKLLNNETERQIAVGKKMSARNSTDIVSQTINNERTTAIVGDSITKNVQGIKLAKTVGHRVVVKPFPASHNSRHARGIQRQFSENICSEDDLRAKFSEHLLLSCLSQGFRTSKK